MGVLLLVSPTERLSVSAEVKKERSANSKRGKEEKSEGPERGRNCICKIT